MDFMVETLGPCRIPSPIRLSKVDDDFITNYVPDDERVLQDPSLSAFHRFRESGVAPPSFEKAGPREHIYFDPTDTCAAIVTCGGLCPGINDVVNSLVLELWHWYGIRDILGIRYGYRGFITGSAEPPIRLNPEKVTPILHTGGSYLGSSRGGVDAKDIVDALERMKVQILFTIGGDGTQKGALDIHEEAKSRGLKIAVVGIPKTIDNDISQVERTFGFETAFTLAVDAIRGAHNEAMGAYNGVGLVKLMGRDSGFIAAHASLASHHVNFVLVPEVPFDLDGENGLMKHLVERLKKRHHAVICVAEGAGQQLIRNKASGVKKDKSGNVLHEDIGIFLCEQIKRCLKKQLPDSTLKYIDPSYMIRSAPAIPTDSVFCSRLGQHAAHAAMAGKTGLIVGRWARVSTHVPIKAVVSERKKIDPESLFWLHVMESTGQPLSMRNG